MENSWEQTKHTHMQRHMHTHLSSDHVSISFQLLSFTSADHFSAWNLASLSPLSINVILHIMQIRAESEDCERSGNLNIHNGSNGDNEGDDSKVQYGGVRYHSYHAKLLKGNSWSCRRIDV